MRFSLGDYLEGLALLLVTLGACAAAALLVTRRRLGHLRGAPGLAAWATLATAFVVLVHLVPGALGILGRATVPLVAVILLAAVAGLLTERGRDDAPGAAEPEEPRLSRAVGGAAVLAVAACAVALAYKSTGGLLTGQDTTNFQVPTVARWLQGDSVWGLHQFVPLYSSATYPQHGNLLILALVLPFDRPFLAVLAAAPYVALAVVVVYAIGRELGAPRGAALMTAALFGAVPELADVGLQGALNDAPTAALLGVAMLFLLRHHREGRRAELWLAALALGLAAGTKWYGVLYAGAITGLWLVAGLIAGRPWRARALQAGQVVAVAGLAGGFWLLRNWVETGNPLFPVRIAPLGVTIFDAAPDVIRERGGFTLLDYKAQPSVWREYLLPAFRGDFGAPGAVLGLGALAAGATALRRPRRGPVLAAVATALLLAVLYAATPYSAFGPEGRPVLATASTRYALPALLAAAAATAWLVGRAGRLRPLLDLVLLAAVVAGLVRGFPDVAARTLALGAAVAVAGGAAVLAVRRGGLRPGRRAAVALAVAAVLVVVAAGDRMRARYEGATYASVDPVYGALLDRAPAGSRVAVAGNFALSGVSAILPAMGPRLANEVDYLGFFERDFLQPYRSAGPFAAALDRGGYDLLVVGRGREPRGGVPEEAWARAAGWEPVAASPSLALLGRPGG